MLYDGDFPGLCVSLRTQRVGSCSVSHRWPSYYFVSRPTEKVNLHSRRLSPPTWVLCVRLGALRVVGRKAPSGGK